MLFVIRLGQTLNVAKLTLDTFKLVKMLLMRNNFNIMLSNEYNAIYAAQESETLVFFGNYDFFSISNKKFPLCTLAE